MQNDLHLQDLGRLDIVDQLGGNKGNERLDDRLQHDEDQRQQRWCFKFADTAEKFPKHEEPPLLESG